MVIPMASIPLYLQKQIAEKMRYSDFDLFHESSKHAMDLGGIAKPSLDVDFIRFDTEGITLVLPRYYQKEISLSDAKKHKKCIRFCSKNTSFFKRITTEQCMQLIEEAEEGWLCCKNVTLEGKPDVDWTDIARLIEVLQSTGIRYYHYERGLMELPMPAKIENVDLNCPLVDADLLLLRAKRMSLKGTEISCSGINRLLKQWLQGERNIVTITITTTNNLFPHLIFYGISQSFLMNGQLGKIYKIETKEDFRVIINARHVRICSFLEYENIIGSLSLANRNRK